MVKIITKSNNNNNKGKAPATSTAAPGNSAAAKRNKLRKTKRRYRKTKAEAAAAAAAASAEPPKAPEVAADVQSGSGSKPSVDGASGSGTAAKPLDATVKKSPVKSKVEGKKTSAVESAEANKGEDKGKDVEENDMKKDVKGKDVEENDMKKDKDMEKHVTEKARKGKKVAEKNKRKEKDGRRDVEEKLSGFIFMCSSKTKSECYQRHVFGMPRGKIASVEKIKPGTRLFLFDFDLKLLYGIYKASSRGRKDIIREAFRGQFPAQVKFVIEKDCIPLPESKLRHAIKENYNSKGKFTPELNLKQVRRISALFKPVSLRRQPTPQHVGDRERYFPRREHVEERQPPRPIRPSPPEDRYRSRHMPLDHQYDHVPNDHHAYYRHVPPVQEHRHVPLVPITALPFDDPYHRVDSKHVFLERVAHRAEEIGRDPLYARDHRVLTGQEIERDPLYARDHRALTGQEIERDPLYARDHRALTGHVLGELPRGADRMGDLFYSDRLAGRELHRHPSDFPAYVDPNRSFAGNLQMPVLSSVNVPSVPVPLQYSFGGPPPSYR